MTNRDTGHFGTGFYMVGTFNPDKAYSYGKRDCWEVDLDKYNRIKFSYVHFSKRHYNRCRKINRII